MVFFLNLAFNYMLLKKLDRSNNSRLIVHFIIKLCNGDTLLFREQTWESNKLAAFTAPQNVFCLINLSKYHFLYFNVENPSTSKLSAAKSEKSLWIELAMNNC